MREVPQTRPSATPAGKSLMMEWSLNYERRKIHGDATGSWVCRAVSGHWKGGLSHTEPISPPHARREADPRAAAGLGAESLYLSKQHSYQGRRHSRSYRGSGVSVGVAQAHHRPRWGRHPARRNREMAETCRSYGTFARTGDSRGWDFARHALRRRRLRRFR